MRKIVPKVANSKRRSQGEIEMIRKPLQLCYLQLNQALPAVL